MKPHFLLLTVAVALLFAPTPDVQALPPRQHSVNGVIETIDCASRTLTLKTKDGAAPLTFVWNDSTRFSRRGGCAKCSFDSGQTMHGWYRREVGRNVLREVSTKGKPAACGAACCCRRPDPNWRGISSIARLAVRRSRKAKALSCGLHPRSPTARNPTRATRGT